MPINAKTWVAPSIDAIERCHNEGGDVSEKIRIVWKMESPDLGSLYDALEIVAPGTDAERRYLRGQHVVNSQHFAKLLAIDVLLRNQGVVYLGHHKRNGMPVRHSDAADSYAATLFTCGRRLYISCVADELSKVRQEEQP